MKNSSARLVVTCVLLLVAARAACADTLAEYRERVEHAASIVEGVAAHGESDEEDEGEETLSDVRSLLPTTEKVERAGGELTVNNRWLHEALDEYEGRADRLKPAERAEALGHISERLRALEARLAELGGGAAQQRDKDAEKGRLNTILQRREFNREEAAQGGALKRLIQQIAEWIRSLLPDILTDAQPLEPGTNARVTQGMQWLVLLLCVAVIAYVVWRFWWRRVRGAKAKQPREARVVLGERLEADQTSADLLEDAERLARAGDLRGAIRKAYIALLCELGDRRVIRLAQHKTNRDYLQAIRQSAPPQLYTELLPLTFNFELHWYGLKGASESDWADFRARCRQALKGI